MRPQEAIQTIELRPRPIQYRTAPAYHFPPFFLCPPERQLYREDQLVQIAPKTFDALVLLVARAEHLVRKDELMEALWPGIYVSETNLTNIVVELRKVLGQEAIHTVSKHGYRFVLPVESDSNVRPAAYAAFLQAKELCSRATVRSMLRVRDLLWLSIAEDPSYAPAWAYLGRCCSYLEKSFVDPAGNFDLATAAFRQAFALDADLGCTHYFYAPLEAELGHSQDALIRLMRRVAAGDGASEAFAPLVQTLRFCGLLNESVSAHKQAVNLDRSVNTSVAQTYLLLGEYKTAIEACGKTGRYVDAAAWAALGEKKRAIGLLEERIAHPHVSQALRALMTSLLAILQRRSSLAIDEMAKVSTDREPEILFFLARHFSKLNATKLAMEALNRAQQKGFVCTEALRRDPWFAAVRSAREFPSILEEAWKREATARDTFERFGGISVPS